MAVPQQKFREVVFQLLYSIEIGNGKEEDLVQLLMKELAVSKKTVRQALERVQLLLEHKKELDDAIGKASQSYSFERIQSVERNILRLGTFEIFQNEDEIPPKVAIAEAVRLARKFGTPESASFVNAILDSIYKTRFGHQTDQQALDKSLAAMEKSESDAKTIIKKLQDTENSGPT